MWAWIKQYKWRVLTIFLVATFFGGVILYLPVTIYRALTGKGAAQPPQPGGVA